MVIQLCLTAILFNIAFDGLQIFSIIFSEGVPRRKSISVGDHDGCFIASFCIRLLGIQKW